MIIVDDVYKRYLTDHGPSKWILQGVTVTIPPKVNVGLVGSNGAGKSTLLRLIGGSDVPNRGRIERHTRVSWPMGLSGGLQVMLTGRQNAKFVCRILGLEEDISERLDSIQDFSELGDAFDEPVRTYSSGMRSRLQFALSLAFEFDVYISDEVTAAGDASFRDKTAKAFKALSDRAGLIMVSHGEGTLRQFCQAGIWLNEGRAYWFDDVNDALKEYKKYTLSAKISHLVGNQVSKSSEHSKLELVKLTKIQSISAMLEKGENGSPERVDHEEGMEIITLAREVGMELVAIWQINNRGYQLKPNATPVLTKKVPQNNSYVELFELYSQCIKVEEA